jgi:hypothetical protein
MGTHAMTSSVDAHRSPVRTCTIALALLVMLVPACAPLSPTAPAIGSQHEVRMKQAPAAAAHCFARNAEAHSSALEAEVHPRGRSMEVLVRVKNGVTYATAYIDPSGSGSVGRIALNVVTTAGVSDLLQRLTEGC